LVDERGAFWEEIRQQMGDLSRRLLNQSKDLETTHKRACEAQGRVAELEGELQILTDQVELMEDQLCHCREDEYQPLVEGDTLGARGYLPSGYIVSSL
jgi:chromosome segregation ATPase